MIYRWEDGGPMWPAAGGQPPPEPELVGAEPTFVGTEDSQQRGEGYLLRVVAEHVEDDEDDIEVKPAYLVSYWFVYPRTHMYFVKKKWGETCGLSPAAVLLEAANGRSLSDGSTPEEMGWTIASRGEPPVLTVYALPARDEHIHNPQARAGRPMVARLFFVIRACEDVDD